MIDILNADLGITDEVDRLATVLVNHNLDLIHAYGKIGLVKTADDTQAEESARFDSDITTLVNNNLSAIAVHGIQHS